MSTMWKHGCEIQVPEQQETTAVRMPHLQKRGQRFQFVQPLPHETAPPERIPQDPSLANHGVYGPGKGMPPMQIVYPCEVSGPQQQKPEASAVSIPRMETRLFAILAVQVESDGFPKRPRVNQCMRWTVLRSLLMRQTKNRNAWHCMRSARI
ncbi:uncharacterized protein [Physcomitrium patens]|uniref:uncharacterized protein isoform X2 n=1 Tax=Physcomitrium patens TaxID=3218 RepID=UPI003CCD8BEA